ncbi:hypothetical protein NDU88_001155 [Pleurodeles waltl]|uniref:Uncharacterized protein n=1 Tax=Pleurodeles waltl TaxID=8319 RepID=A0AAV7MKZ5_PLEWA|nr:hypothetical protein NDU88_001155 [Pleurodeles waltl]
MFRARVSGDVGEFTQISDKFSRIAGSGALVSDGTSCPGPLNSQLRPKSASLPGTRHRCVQREPLQMARAWPGVGHDDVAGLTRLVLKASSCATHQGKRGSQE